MKYDDFVKTYVNHVIGELHNYVYKKTYYVNLDYSFECDEKYLNKFAASNDDKEANETPVPFFYISVNAPMKVFEDFINFYSKYLREVSLVALTLDEIKEEFKPEVIESKSFNECLYMIEEFVRCQLHTLLAIRVLSDFECKNESMYKFIEMHQEYYDTAYKEIKSGKKLTHWIWYIFPQISGLGKSPIARTFELSGALEAIDFMETRYLFDNLLEISKALLDLPTSNILDVVEYPDNLKIQSCMTLFSYVSGNHVFQDVLNKYFGGKECTYTKSRL